MQNCAGKSGKGVGLIKITKPASKFSGGDFNFVSRPFVSDSQMDLRPVFRLYNKTTWALWLVDIFCSAVVAKNLPLFHAHIPPMSYFIPVPTPIHSYRHLYSRYFAYVRVCIMIPFWKIEYDLWKLTK